MHTFAKTQDRQAELCICMYQIRWSSKPLCLGQHLRSDCCWSLLVSPASLPKNLLQKAAHQHECLQITSSRLMCHCLCRKQCCQSVIPPKTLLLPRAPHKMQASSCLACHVMQDVSKHAGKGAHASGRMHGTPHRACYMVQSLPHHPGLVA